MTDEEWDWLRRLGFEQSPFTQTRWCVYGPVTDEYDQGLRAWIDLTPQGWKLKSWRDGAPFDCDTLGLELVPMLAFALAEGWL